MTWCTSNDSGEVIGAFAGALGELVDVAKSHTADAGKYSYRYADLAAVLDVVRPVLHRRGLGITQHVTSHDGAVQVTTSVLHTSGQWLTFAPFTMRVAGNDPQSVGSALTYARRYALLAVCNLATEDDDGAAASRPTATSSRRAPGVDWGALGWTTQAEHDTHREQFRSAAQELPDDVRRDLLVRWDELGLSWPLSRAQVDEWAQVVGTFIAQHEATQPAETPPPRARRSGPSSPAPAELLDEVRAAGAAAQLTEAEIVATLASRFGREIPTLDALTVAQGRAAVEMLTARPEGG